MWYEYGEGISTNGSTVWGQRITADNQACFCVIAEKHPELKDICDWHRGKASEGVVNKYEKIRAEYCMYNIPYRKSTNNVKIHILKALLY